MYINLKEYYIDNPLDIAQEVFLEEEISCGMFNVVNMGQVIGPNEQGVKLLFPNDGTFKVKLGFDDNGIAKSYINLFTSMITYIEASLCGLKGGNCKFPTTSTGQAENYANIAYSKLILYSAVSTPEYDDSTLESFEKIRCALNTTSSTLRRQEELLGTTDPTLLLRMEMAYMYVYMYKKDQENERGAELDKLYNYDMISYCIIKLGIVLDTKVCPPPPGILHTHSMKSLPSMIELGVPINLNVVFTFTKNDDEFHSILSTDVAGMTDASFNGNPVPHTVVNLGQSQNFTVVYKYERGGQLLPDTAKAATKAYAMQWYGGETVLSDFSSYSEQLFEDTFTNITGKLQSNSNSTSTNSGTKDKYIYWVTNRPIKFFVGAFEMPLGAWSSNCNPNSEAIIWKKVNVTMKDNTTTQDMYIYRTCPLQDLTGQDLVYILKQ